MCHRLASGHVYLLTITNSFSHMHFLWLLPSKSSVVISAALQAITVTFPPSLRVHHVRLNNARELDTLIGQWILKVGGKCEPTPPYTSEYNGIDKRFNHKIMTRMHCLLFDAHLPSEWWAKATQHACDIINVSPTRSNPNSASPYSLWHGVPPPSCHLRVFGALGMMHLHAHE